MFGDLGNMKMMGTLAGLLKNKDKMKASAERVQAEIERVRAVGEGGGGAARAVATGRMRIERIDLEPALAAGLAEPGAREYAQSLIAEAVNSALDGAEAQVRSAVQAEAKALGLDDVFGDAISDLGTPGGGIGSIGKLLGQ